MSSVSSAGRAARAASGCLLTVDSVDARHGLLAAVRGVSFTSGGRAARAGRRERCGQDDPAAHDRRGAPARRPGRCGSTAPTSRGCRRTAASALGIALVPEGRRLFPRAHRPGEPARRGPARPARTWTVDTVLDAFPMLRPLRAQAGLDAVRRRAADHRDRPRADDQPAPAAARRGLAGARAARRRRGVRVAGRARRRAARRCCSSSRTWRARCDSPTASSACSRGASCSRRRRPSLTREQVTEAYFGLVTR